MENALLARSRDLAHGFIKFVNEAISPYHAVRWFADHLNQKGFHELKEVENWQLEAGKKYYFTRNFTTIVAFTVGQKFNANQTGFNLIGAHTDSPCLKLNPVSKATNKGIEQCVVGLYGGGLWHTWFDRDLVVAGKVVYQKDRKYTSSLWRSESPLLKVPNLAIHLTDRSATFTPDK